MAAQSGKGPVAVSHVFISYSREDASFMRKLHDRMDSGRRKVWVDWKGIPPTAEFMDEIYAAIEAADCFVFIISPASVASDVCNRELEHALKHHKRILPVLYRDVDFRGLPGDKPVKKLLDKIQWIVLRDAADFGAGCRRIFRIIDTDLDYARRHTRLLTRAIEWEKKRREPSYLLRGRDLADAQGWLVESYEKEPNPTALQIEYITESQKQQAEESRRWKELYEESKLWDMESSVQTGTIHLGEEHSINAVKFSPGGRLIATGGATRLLKLWDTESGRLIRTLPGHAAVIQCIDFDAKGERVASGGEDNVIKLWRVESGREILTLEGHGDEVSSISFHPGGGTIASGGRDDAIKIWNTESGDLVKTLEGHANFVNGVKFSPDGRLLVSASSDKTLKIWSTDDWETIGTLEGHTNAVRAVDFNPDGKPVISLGYDGLIKIWDIADGTELYHVETPDDAELGCVRFHPRGTHFATGDSGSQVKIWNREMDRMKIFSGHSAGVRAAAFSPDGLWIASGGDDGTVRIRNVSGGPAGLILKSDSESILSLDYSAGGRRLASGGADGKLILWDLATDHKNEIWAGHTGISCLAFSPDGAVLAVGLYYATILLWDIHGGRELAKLDSHQVGEVLSIRFSPDGLAIAAGYNAGNIILWDAVDKRKITSLDAHHIGVNSVDFSPCGKMPVSGSGDGTVSLWDFNLDTLITGACGLLKPYLKNNPGIKDEDRCLCDPIP